MSYYDDIKKEIPQKIEKKEKSKKDLKYSFFSFFAEQGTAFAIVLLTIASMLIILISSFDFANGGLSLKNIDATAIVLAVLVYLIYLNCYPAGKQAHERKNDFLKANEEYQTRIKKIAEQKIEYKLYDFCRDYIAQELKEARLLILHSNNLNYAIFEKYCDGFEFKNLNVAQIEALEKAKNLKPKKLTKAQLYNEHDNEKRKDFISSYKKIFLYRLCYGGLKLVTTVLSVVFALQLGCEIVLSFSPETLMKSMLQFLIIALTFFSGIRQGWNEVKLQINRVHEQITVLDAFFSWESSPEVKKRYNEQLQENKRLDCGENPTISN